MKRSRSKKKEEKEKPLKKKKNNYFSDKKRGNKTSFERSSRWYNEIVGEKGHYYHQKVIFPYLLNYIKNNKDILSILDLGCGQGAFSRTLSNKYTYFGIDISKSLIQNAKKFVQSKKHQFALFDVTKDISLDKKDFALCIMILSLQNMKDPLKVFQNAKNHLKNDGKLILILNHPCFRIPKYSSWDIDKDQKIQSRKIDKYLSNLEIPIKVHPGKKDNDELLYSYHYSLSYLSKLLQKNSFCIEEIDELISNKTSYGKMAKMENKARNEFPLFMSLICRKI